MVTLSEAFCPVATKPRCISRSIWLLLAGEYFDLRMSDRKVKSSRRRSFSAHWVGVMRFPNVFYSAIRPE